MQPISIPLPSSPPPPTDTSNPVNWSRHLIQQTLMDEGLRLARMVSHGRDGRISLGSEGTHSTGEFSKWQFNNIFFTIWYLLILDQAILAHDLSFFLFLLSPCLVFNVKWKIGLYSMNPTTQTEIPKQWMFYGSRVWTTVSHIISEVTPPTMHSWTSLDCKLERIAVRRGNRRRQRERDTERKRERWHRQMCNTVMC